MSIRNNYPTVNPTLDLDFANTRRLDPRVTFTRSSTATYYDGSRALAEQNLLLNSQTFNTTWVASSITFATGITDPLGTTTAYTATASGANATVYQSVIIPADTFTFSIYVQRVTGTGTINLTLDGTTMTVASVTGSWVRYTATQALTAGTYTVGIQIVTSGDAVNIWGAQLEQRSSASAYNVTTTSIVANYISVLKTAAINQPRFDVDPVTGESKGLLIEESRTNLVTYSEQFDNAAWSKSNATVTANAIVAPDGTLSADKFIPDSTLITDHTVNTATVTIGTTYTVTVYAKAAGYNYLFIRGLGLGGSGGARFNLQTGVVEGVANYSSASITALSNGWYRCIATGTALATTGVYFNVSNQATFAAFSGDGTSGIYIWGAQLEAGSFPTSYIPTTSAQVTRTADNASMTGTNFSSWYNQSEGTVAITVDSLAPITAAYFLTFMRSAGYGPRIQIAMSGVANTSSASVVDDSSTVVCSLARTGLTSTFAYKTDDYAFSANALSVVTDTSGTVPSGIVQAKLGQSPVNDTLLNGHIKSIRYYPARVTNAQLQALTSI